MKKLLAALLITALLSGCAAVPDPSPSTEETEAPPRRVCGELLPGASREDLGLRAYALPLEHCTGLLELEDGVLICSGTERSTLSYFSGEELLLSAAFTAEGLLGTDAPGIRLTEQGISFFDPADGNTLILDRKLGILRRIAAPEGLCGEPVLSYDEDRLYYCTSEALMVWELDSGIRRAVARCSYPGQQVSGLAQNDREILVRYQEGSENRTVILDAEDGHLLSLQGRDYQLLEQGVTRYEQFFTGQAQILRWGTREEGAYQLIFPNPDAQGFFLPGQNQALSITLPTVEQTQLCLYSLSTGLPVMEMTLNLGQQPMVVPSAAGGAWILGTAPENEAAILYHWNPLQTAALPGAQSCRYPCSDQDHPDRDGMEQCLQTAAAISSAYGIRILVGSQAASDAPWDYRLEPEDNPALLARELGILADTLALYPPSLLADTLNHFDGFSLRLVRSVKGRTGSALAEASGILFFQEGCAEVACSTGPWFRRTVCHELYHAMQPYLTAHTDLLERWDGLNPEGFTYGKPEDRLLSGADAAFIDRYAMTDPEDDQARILEYAMLPGQEVLFAKPILQAKLSLLCRAIRDAYRLEDPFGSLPWEQYCSESSEQIG